MSARHRHAARTRAIQRERRAWKHEPACWCGEPHPWCADTTSGLRPTCGGTGMLDCECGGDLCVCHNHGEVECFGCIDCDYDDENDLDNPYANDDESDEVAR